MSRPVFLTDNLFNTRIYPDHVLDASTTTSGTSVLRLASGRRKATLTGWTAATENAEAWVEAICDMPRGFDLLWIDREHNLDSAATPRVGLRLSDDDFATYTELGPFDIPADPVPAAGLFEGGVVRTNEGALLVYLGDQVATDVRVFIPAMGSGLKPILPGLMLGKLWTPYHAPGKPFDYGRPELLREITRTPQAQSTGADIGSYRHGQVRIQPETWWEYLEAVYSLEELYVADGKPLVYVPDDELAELALLATAPAGQQGFEIPTDHYLPGITLAFAETEPILR